VRNKDLFLKQEIIETRNHLSQTNARIADLEAGRGAGSLSISIAYRKALEKRLRKLEQDFAVATGTAVHGMHFNALLRSEAT
jgi:hypothetical protein